MLNHVNQFDDLFYSRLLVNKIPLSKLLLHNECFVHFPPDWQVIITDVKGSTDAVLAGRHQEINLIATGSTVAVLNIAFNENIPVPFFFGGDGATFLIPSSLIDKVISSLQVYSATVASDFGLELRVGLVSVSEVYAEGHDISIAKYGASNSYTIPIVLGTGLSFAESLIKGAYKGLPEAAIELHEPDITGMLCRWDEIPAPTKEKEIITLLVVSAANNDQASVFSRVIREIDKIFGLSSDRQPITLRQLRLKSTFKKISQEAERRSGKAGWLSRLRDRYLNLLGYIYFRMPKGVNYLQTLVEASDTLLIDGKINSVFTGTAVQRQELQSFLDSLETSGKLIYGLHVSKAAIMSCYVRNPKDGHIYFVDGAKGGYTMAATMLKQKLRSSKSSSF